MAETSEFMPPLIMIPTDVHDDDASENENENVEEYNEVYLRCDEYDEINSMIDYTHGFTDCTEKYLRYPYPIIIYRVGTKENTFYLGCTYKNFEFIKNKHLEIAESFDNKSIENMLIRNTPEKLLVIEQLAELNNSFRREVNKEYNKYKKMFYLVEGLQWHLTTDGDEIHWQDIITPLYNSLERLEENKKSMLSICKEQFAGKNNNDKFRTYLINGRQYYHKNKESYIFHQSILYYEQIFTW